MKELLTGLAVVGGFAMMIGLLAAGYIWLMLQVTQ